MAVSPNRARSQSDDKTVQDPYITGPMATDRWTLIAGAAEDALPQLQDGSVQTTITSPPYYRQKDYGEESQLGWEPSVDEYVTRLKGILGHVFRVTADDGSCFLVIGDSFVRQSLQLIPHRLALAAISIGWTVRNDLVWAKTDPAPDGSRNRWRQSHEHIWFLTKRASKYRFHADAIRVPYSASTILRWGKGQKYGGRKAQPKASPAGQRFKRGQSFRLHPIGPLGPDVLHVATARSRLQHYATFPESLIEKFVRATTDPHDVVLDPFAGTATTGVVALRNHRRFVGIDISREYLRLAEERLQTCSATHA